MADEQEPPLIACVRVSHPDKLVTVGSTKTPCVRCGEEVWIAESSRKRAPVVHAVCLECCQNEIAEVVAGKRELSPMTDDQAFEIIATLYKEPPHA